jgi:hypothetical protein
VQFSANLEASKEVAVNSFGDRQVFADSQKGIDIRELSLQRTYDNLRQQNATSLFTINSLRLC